MLGLYDAHLPVLRLGEAMAGWTLVALLFVALAVA